MNRDTFFEISSCVNVHIFRRISMINFHLIKDIKKIRTCAVENVTYDVVFSITLRIGSHLTLECQQLTENKRSFLAITSIIQEKIPKSAPY